MPLEAKDRACIQGEKREIGGTRGSFRGWRVGGFSQQAAVKEKGMAFYLVSAIPRADRMDDLHARLAADEFVPLRPFGPTVSRSLRNARRRPDGVAVWEEEDYCRPPLAQEREAVLIITSRTSG